MGVLLESSTLELLLIVAVLELVLLVMYFTRKFSYWTTKEFPFPKPVFPFGNITSAILSMKHLGLCFQDLYKEMKQRGEKYCGIYVFSKPVFMPLDPELIKMVMTKDFGSFHDRGVYYDEEVDPLSAHLFSIDGMKWKTLRTKLSPTFTSGKMKMMFHTMVNCTQDLGDVLDEVSGRDEALDVKDIAARFTTDIIASCAFGLECNSLKNPSVEFRKYGRKIFELEYLDILRNIAGLTFPEVLRAWRIPLTKKDVSKFFIDVIKQTVEYREANKVERKDMVDLLLKMMHNESIDDDKKPAEGEEPGITFNQMAAQCFLFFIGGFETSSITLTFLLFELSQNPDIQDKLRREIRQVLDKHSGQITYEAIMEMTYMDKVINETLRKYPPGSFLMRMATQDWRIPGTNSIVDKGTFVIIPNYAIQMDPEYFSNPEIFDPERFSEENKSKRHPYCHLPFGEGPRNCIGMRFGLLQTKVGLTMFLKDHRFHLHSKTSLPIKFDSRSMVFTHEGGIWLKMTSV